MILTIIVRQTGLVFSALLLTAAGAFAQQTYLDLLLNGVNTTVNYGKANAALGNYKKSLLGVQLGGSFQAGITPHFSLVSECYFMMKGSTLKPNNFLTVNQSTLRLYTLELPMLARYHLGRFYANAGPYIAYTLGGKLAVDGSDALPEKKTPLVFDHSNGAFNRWEAGVQVGGGYLIPLKKARLAIDIRYAYGLTSISTNVDRYNRYLNINLLISKPWHTNPLGCKKP